MAELTEDINFKTKAQPTRAGRALFCRLVAVMLRAGIKLPEAIRVAGADSHDPAIQDTSFTVFDELLRRGKSLPAAVASCPNMFGILHLGLIRSGEEIGNYDVIFSHIAESDEMADRLHRRLLAALIQPAFILMGILLFAVFGPRFFVPHVRAMMSEFGLPLPVFSQLVFGLAEFVGSGSFWLILVATLVVLQNKKWKLFQKKESLRRALYALCYRLPGVSGILRSLLHAHWARLMSMQLEAGTRIVDALRNLLDGLEDPKFNRACKDTLDSIKQGATLAQAMAATGYFDKVVVGTVAVGEENGNVPDLLARLARFYDEDLHTRLDTFDKLLTPVLMLIGGVAVGAWVIAIILPMSQVIGGMVK